MSFLLLLNDEEDLSALPTTDLARAPVAGSPGNVEFGSAPPVLAVANYANAGGSNVSSVDTSANPFNSTTGSTFVIWVTYNAPAALPSSVFDNKGNVYALKLSNTTFDGCWGYVCENGIGGAGHYATVNLPHSDYPSMHFAEMAAVTTTSYDTAAAAIGVAATTPFTQATGTLSQADEIILSFIGSPGSGGVDIYSENSGFTLLGQQNNSAAVWASALAYKVVAATTPVTASWTITNGAGNTTVAVMGFKAAAGGPVTLNAAATQTLDGVSQAATVVVPVALNAGQTLDGVTQSATLTTATARNLSAAQTLAGVAQTATATARASIVAGQTLLDVVNNATASALARLNAAQTLDGISQSANANHGALSITAAQTLAGITQAASVAHAGATLSAAQILDGVTTSASVAALARINAAQVLDNIIQLANLSLNFPFQRNERTFVVESLANRVYSVGGQDRDFDAVGSDRNFAGIAASNRTITLKD